MGLIKDADKRIFVVSYLDRKGLFNDLELDFLATLLSFDEAAERTARELNNDLMFEISQLSYFPDSTFADYFSREEGRRLANFYFEYVKPFAEKISYCRMIHYSSK
ncbi:MAG: hypothetical protein ACP5D2_01630 [Candidatus Nanoarchaeia archaeon]